MSNSLNRFTVKSHQTTKGGVINVYSSPQGKMEVEFWYDSKHDCDMVYVSLVPNDGGEGSRQKIYCGPLKGVNECTL